MFPLDSAFSVLSIRDGAIIRNSTNIPFVYAPFGVVVPEGGMTCPPIF
jgi:hypothetical protein